MPQYDFSLHFASSFCVSSAIMFYYSVAVFLSHILIISESLYHVSYLIEIRDKKTILTYLNFSFLILVSKNIHVLLKHKMGLTRVFSS